MRKYFITFLFLALLAASTVLFMRPADTESILAENRQPKTLPVFSLSSALDGSFESEFDEYVNDNIGCRGRLMEISDKIHSFYGYMPEGVGRIISTTSDVGTGAANDSQLVLYDDSIMEMFISRPQTQAKYADTLNKIRDIVPDNVKMYSMLIPTRLEFCDPVYAHAQDSQYNAINSVYNLLSPDITTVDVYSKLQNASQTEDYLYYLTDHHWNADGAYYGYEAFSLAKGAAPMPKSNYAYRENGTFYGSLYQKARSQIVGTQPQDICFYYDTASGGNISMKMRAEDAVTEYAVGSPMFHTEHGDYLVFFGGDNPLMEITNSAKPDGDTLLIIKDSYANALIPWLVNDYKQVIVIDPRSFGGDVNAEIERYGVDEIMTVNYIFTTTFDDMCDSILGLFNK